MLDARALKRFPHQKTRPPSPWEGAIAAAQNGVGRGLSRCGDHDLDIVARRCKPGLDGGACRRVSFGYPPVPNRVHFSESRHIGEINRRAQQFRFVASSLCKMAIDNREHLLGLLRHAAAGRLVGHDTSEIDGVAVDHDLAHAWTRIEALDVHVALPLVWRDY